MGRLRRRARTSFTAASVGLLLAGVLLPARTQNTEGNARRSRPSVPDILQRYPDADKDGDGRLDEDERKALRQRLRRERDQKAEAVSRKGVAATHVDVKYGAHERNVLDIWLAEPKGANTRRHLRPWRRLGRW